MKFVILSRPHNVIKAGVLRFHFLSKSSFPQHPRKPSAYFPPFLGHLTRSQNSYPLYTLPCCLSPDRGDQGTCSHCLVNVGPALNQFFKYFFFVLTPPSFSDSTRYVIPPAVLFIPIVMLLPFIPSCSNHSYYIIRLGSTESPCFPTNIHLCHTLVEPQHLHTPTRPDCFIANLHHPPVVRQGLPLANWRTPHP